MSVRCNRQWALPNKVTFDIPPIREFVKKYLRESKVSVDPFARDKRLATFTNDLNPQTAAEYHKSALVFLRWLRMRKIEGIDLVLFDPPYSRRQVMECYAGVGRAHVNADSQYFSLNWKDERALIDDILQVDGIVLSFGWHTNGMQQSGRYQLLEVLVVAHGGAHHDTLCIAERKLAHQWKLW